MPDRIQDTLSPGAVAETKPQKPQTEMERDLNAALPVPGFFPRTVAFVVDLFLLTIVFGLAASRLYETLYPVRDLMCVVGFLLAFLYFWLSGSPLMKGQTLGKKLLRIRLVGLDAQPPSMGRAFLHALLLQPLLFAYAYGRRYSPLGPAVPTPNDPAFQQALMVLGGICAAFALPDVLHCAMHPRKRAWHDLLAGTAVVRAGAEQWGVDFVKKDLSSLRGHVFFARFMALSVGALILFALGRIWLADREGAAERHEMFVEARATLGPYEDYALAAVFGPHAEYFETSYQPSQIKKVELFEEYSRDENRKEEQDRYRPATTVTLATRTGREVIFIIDDLKTKSPEEIQNDPEAQALIAQLPLLAESLSDRYWRDEEGEEQPYEIVKYAFYEELSFYLTCARTIPHWGYEAVGDPDALFFDVDDLSTEALKRVYWDKTTATLRNEASTPTLQTQPDAPTEP